MKQFRTLTRVMFFAVIAACIAPHVYAQDANGAPDNSQVNTRDRDSSEMTSDNASNQKSDRVIMKEIRKAVVDDASLSTYAHNVKIISSQGHVTLKGPVKSEDESRNIEAKATKVVGDGNVVNRLSVKSEQ